MRAAGGGGVVGFGGDAFGRQAFLKLAVMLRYKNGKATAASALGMGVLDCVRTEIDFLPQSAAKVRVSGHRGWGSNLRAGSPCCEVNG